MEAEVELEEVEQQKERRQKVEQKLELIRQRQRTISQQRRMDEGWPTGKRKHFEEGDKKKQEEAEDHQQQQDGTEREEGEDQDLIPNDSDEDGQQSDEEREQQRGKEREEPLLCRKVIYASRTHSQLEQFAQELAKTGFRPRVLTLGSRQMLCVNDAVRSLGVAGLINDRCNELLSGNSGGGEKRARRGEHAQMTKAGKSTGGCEFAHADAIEDLCGAALVGNVAQSRSSTTEGDVRELYELGRRRRACPYFASRAALGLCQLVLVPYNILLHKSTREAWRLNLRDNVLIVDEAHNLLQTLASIHAVELSTGQLSLCSALIHDYLERFRKRLSPRNLRHIRQLHSLTVAVHNLATSTAKEEEHGGAEERVLTLTQFMAKLGSASDIDLFRLLDYLDQSKLCRKLRDFRLRHSARGHSQPTVASAEQRIGAVGLKSHRDRSGQKPKQRQTVKKEMPRGNLGSENIPPSANGHGETATPADTNSTPLYQLRESIEAITSRTDDARVVISRRRPVGDASTATISDVRLRFLLLNPAARLGDLVSQARALILLGGTMRPTDQLVDALQRVCSVPDSRIVQFTCGHIIDDKQLIALQIGNGPNGAAQPLNLQFSARGSPQALTAMAQCLLALLRSVPNGAVAFFPSYAFLASFVHHLRTTGQWEQLQSVKRIHVETKEAAETAKNGAGKGQQKQMQQIWPAFCESARSREGAVLFAVVGGKLSEGINFSDELGRCVLMVGLPYANRNSAELSERIRYLDQHIGPGAGTRFYEQLCQQAINQAIGRAIRHRADFAAIVLLDERYARDTIAAGLPGWIRQRLTRAVPLPEALRRLNIFFSVHNCEKASHGE
ncbi:hypothetical protein niasHT_030761 [Heterodera trifolii]|uniref:Helicase ATP-binding domain-containing protein n=1 Tax=Heterodera trifolii TaxID=157864 RepID=A0ABD2HUN8_9BILA